MKNTLLNIFLTIWILFVITASCYLLLESFLPLLAVDNTDSGPSTLIIIPLLILPTLLSYWSKEDKLNTNQSIIFTILIIGSVAFCANITFNKAKSVKEIYKTYTQSKRQTKKITSSQITTRINATKVDTIEIDEYAIKCTKIKIGVVFEETPANCSDYKIIDNITSQETYETDDFESVVVSKDIFLYPNNKTKPRRPSALANKCSFKLMATSRRNKSKTIVKVVADKCRAI